VYNSYLGSLFAGREDTAVLGCAFGRYGFGKDAAGAARSRQSKSKGRNIKMKILRITSNLLALAVLALGFTSMASAQATRTWVSGVGDDANPCSRTAPCKTFAGAISKTATNGEIDCLDPGGFGQVTITKAITIDCDSGPGGILAASGSGVVINTTGAVILRSLNINCNVQATNGINVIGATSVHFLDMNIWGCTGAGILVGTGATVNLTVKDTQIHECPTGISTSASAGFVAGDINNVSIWNATTAAISAGTASHLNVERSTFFQSPLGISIPNGATGGPTVGAVGNTFSFINTTFQANTGGNLGASGNFITGSVTVFNPNGGTVSTATDNVSYQNAGPGMANGPAITKI
jgi:hypothetical protein